MTYSSWLRGTSDWGSIFLCQNMLALILQHKLNFSFQAIHRGKAHSNKTVTPLESMNMDIWVVGTALYTKFLNWNKIFPKIKQLLAKLRSLWKVHFVLLILFVLTLASDTAFLYRNVAFWILILSTKRLYSSVLKRACVFQKIHLKVKVLKTFKISSDCYIKIWRCLKRRAALKIRSIFF